MLLDLRSLLESADTAITPLVGELKVVGEQALKIAGPLVLTGYAPIVLIGTIQIPSLAALTLTGQTPGVRVDTFLAAAQGSLALVGQQGSIQIGAGDAGDTSLTPAVGALALVGSAAITTVETFITPLVGSLSLAGIAPTVQVTAHQSITPNAGALAVSGNAPEVQKPVELTPTTGALAITGAKPTVSAPSGDLGPIPMRRIGTKGIRWIKVGLPAPALDVETASLPPALAEVPTAYEDFAITPGSGALAATGELAGSVLADLLGDVAMRGLVHEPREVEGHLLGREINRESGIRPAVNDLPAGRNLADDVHTPGAGLDSVDVHVASIAQPINYALIPATGQLTAIGIAPTLTLGTEGEDEARRWFERIVQDEDEALVLSGDLLVMG